MKSFLLAGVLTVSACLLVIDIGNVGESGEMEPLQKVALRADSASVDETSPAGLNGNHNSNIETETATKPWGLEIVSMLLLGMCLLLFGGVLRGRLSHRVLDSVLMPKTLECENNTCEEAS